MVLYHTATNTYAHPFPAVTLAYFLRYSSPAINPFATHVLSTDTISNEVDPSTGRLHMTRIHLKKSRMPAAIFKLLPASVTGGGSAAEKASYILETVVVDMREGWMRTESRNLNFTGVLSVVEKQLYKAPGGVKTPVRVGSQSNTDVTTTVVFRSRLGEKIRGRLQDVRDEGRLSGWMGKRIQSSIEKMASTKTVDQLGRSREGMRVVLERLRNTGVMGMLEMARREKQMHMA
ncbi:related to UPS1 Mitochondrial intermembrane space protein that regulates alternative processing and sorting of Mgm1p and other proteins [Cephalotrichum gorgonifer]|uniref:Related to UPS1 Mitochondrial intermembrane space protein that regulates alternative processing and sorting of Mgm1p and other proteins n=1 Tax=Cephalotrichum gorgonifer TaxID=2041049 RepID=A0AAE8SRB4_9PEZI|nr:related to UPS1 Mitochondrial intermembrane space protein that regulates alternative processing and sorting of Mgm1p and other proteins [Cephalotrichum gorgonifer]